MRSQVRILQGALLVRVGHPTRRLIFSVSVMTLACLGHWYISLLYLAPVLVVMGGLWIVSQLEKRREGREATDASPPHDSVGVAH
jgi:hypothetical protein